jgi:hypothetical protein
LPLGAAAAASIDFRQRAIDAVRRAEMHTVPTEPAPRPPTLPFLPVGVATLGFFSRITQVFVNENGNTTVQSFGVYDTVADFKRSISRHPDDFYLTFRTKPLSDGHKLADYDIKTESTLVVNYRVRGGSPFGALLVGVAGTAIATTCLVAGIASGAGVAAGAAAAAEIMTQTAAGVVIAAAIPFP